MARRCYRYHGTSGCHYKFVRITDKDKGEAYLYRTHENFILGHNAQHLYLEDPHDCPKFDQVAAGGAHFLLLAQNNPSPLYITGDNRFGQFGELEVFSKEGHLHEISFFSKDKGFPCSIASISCGYRHSIALTEDGDAYIWGWVQNENDPFSGPAPVDVGNEDAELPNITAVACAAEASLFLLQDGTVWTVGERGTMKARQIPLPKPALQIAAAQWSYYALTYA